MPIWLNLILLVGSQGIGALGSVYLVMTNQKGVEAAGINFVFACFASFLLGAIIPRLLIRSFVPARCPKCSGRAFARGGRPITYNCRDCGYVHTTSVSEGDD